ncbi:MAG: 2-C-methyl-D-erythritol 2,4-cyclodiphosphate synthase [Candidatus Omnitrophica bacterium]|nr:2-C-methyl-D-erythritol 2,4-cyclodiphosphate synthase [Candidatus Omnitrophota bacterium]
MKIGLGFDVHRLVKGRKLILGGVEIPYTKGLAGISDADVILHSVCDAILGALGKGDIGDYFPPEDPKCKGISSKEILKKVLKLLGKRRINNIDITVILERPKLKSFKQKIVQSLCKLLKLPETKLNLKVKSQEGLIPARKECLFCISVAVIQ